MPRTGGSWKWAAAAVAVLAAGAVAVVLIVAGRDNASSPRRTSGDIVRTRVGPGGGSAGLGEVRVTVPAGAVAGSTVLTIRRAGAGSLLAGARPISSVYDVSLSRPLKAAVEVAFRIPANSAPDAALAVAHGSHGPGLAALLQGKRANARLSVRVRSLSPLQALDVKGLFGSGAARVSKTAKSIFDQLGPWVGYRGSPPSCSSGAMALSASVSGPKDDPLAYATVCDDHGRAVLEIVNNRAFAWEFEVPGGMHVERAKGRGFSETVWDEINKYYKSGWGLLPGAGSVRLTGASDGGQVALRRERTTLATDALLFILSRGKSGTLGEVSSALELFQCAVSVANTPGDKPGPYALVRNAVADCGGLLDGDSKKQSAPKQPPARTPLEWAKRAGEKVKKTASKALKRAVGAASSVLGATKVLVGITDAFLSGNKEVTISVRRQVQLIRVARSGKPLQIGDFNIAGGDQFLSDAIRAFGRPSSRRGTGADDCHASWDQPSIEVSAATFAAVPGGRHCAPNVEYVQDVIIRSPEFQTESGVHVGMSVADLRKAEPRASTRFTGSLYGDRVAGSDSTYRIAEMHTGIGTTGVLVTLAAHARGGRVIALEVTPLLGGD